MGIRYAAAALARGLLQRRRIGTAIVLTVLLASGNVLAGCGQAAKKINSTPVAAASKSGLGAAGKPILGTRSAPGLPSFQGGVIVYADGNDAGLLPDANRLLDHLVTVKVNIVALAFPLYQSNWTSTDVHADASKTPSDIFIAGFIDAAHQRGLAVLLRPLIDDTPLMKSGHWRGQLKPSDPGAWFASYKSALMSVSTLAQAHAVEVLDIGTELNSLQTNTAAWLDLIAAIRTSYKGQLTYSSNWDVAYPAFGSALDFASVDAFYPLMAPDNASVGQLVSAWQPWAAKISQVRTAFGKPVVLTELGTTSEVGSYRSPYKWQHGGQVSLEAQRAYYAAACQALKPIVVGMYWWVYYTNYFDKIVPAADPGYQPAGKPAEREITACYQ